MPEPGCNDEAVLLTAFARRFQIEPGDSLPAVISGTIRTLHLSGLASCPEYVYPMPPGVTAVGQDGGERGAPGRPGRGLGPALTRGHKTACRGVIVSE